MKNQPTTYLQKYKLKVKQPLILGQAFFDSFIKSCIKMRLVQDELTGVIIRPALTNTLQFKIEKFWNKFDGISLRGLRESVTHTAMGLSFTVILKILHAKLKAPLGRIKSLFVERKTVEWYLEPTVLLNALLKGQSIDQLIITFLYNVYYTTLLRVMADNPLYQPIHIFIINKLKSVQISPIPEGLQLPSIDYNKLISVFCGDKFWIFKTPNQQTLTDLMLILYLISSILLKAAISTSWLYWPLASIEIKGANGWTPLTFSYPTDDVEKPEWSGYGDTMPSSLISLINSLLLHYDRFIVPQLLNVTSVRFPTPKVTWLGAPRLLDYTFLNKWFDFYLKSMPVGYYSIELPFGELFLMSAYAHKHLAVAMRAVFTELKRLKKD